jgi:hypothetical protein
MQREHRTRSRGNTLTSPPDLAFKTPAPTRGGSQARVVNKAAKSPMAFGAARLTGGLG